MPLGAYLGFIWGAADCASEVKDVQQHTHCTNIPSMLQDTGQTALPWSWLNPHQQDYFRTQSGEDTAQSTSPLQEAQLPPANYWAKHIQGHHTPTVSSCPKASIYLEWKKHQLAHGTSSRAVHTLLLMDLGVLMTERRWAKVLGQDREMHKFTAQAKWREKEGWSSAPGLVFPLVFHKYHNLQHLCCNCTHIHTRLTSLGSSPSYVVAPLGPFTPATPVLLFLNLVLKYFCVWPLFFLPPGTLTWGEIHQFW